MRSGVRSLAGFASLLVVVLVAGCGSSGVGSIGAVLVRDRLSGAVHIRELPAGGAAAAAGLQPGDQVKMVDGVLADDLSPQALRGRLRGEVGKPVTLTIVRGERVMQLTLVREPLRTRAAPPPRYERVD